MRRSKYGAVKVEVDGHKFDSKKEGNRYVQLKLMQLHGKITDLELQPVFKISKGDTIDPRTKRRMAARKYKADFSYKDADGNSIVEDVKSPITAKEMTYRLKRQLFLEQYGSEYVFLET